MTRPLMQAIAEMLHRKCMEEILRHKEKSLLAKATKKVRYLLLG
jgi:hypothetical protein